MTMRIPSPADLAARPPRPLTARPVSITAPRRDEPAAEASWRSRWDYAVKHSGMHPHSRLVALTAASYADPLTGAIESRGDLGISKLAFGSGLYEGTVKRALQELVKEGFMTRAQVDGGRSVCVELHIPTAGQPR